MSNPDDLDDGLVYDFDEQEETVLSDTTNNNNDSGDEVVENEESNQKRREISSDDEDETKTLSKRQKKLQSSKLRQKKKDQIQFEISKKQSIPKSNPDIIADYFTSLIREKNPDLSALELEELYLKKINFISTESFTDERDLENFSQFMIKYSRAPKAIVFSMSNMRVADVSRQLGGGKNSVKLFAKNKLDQDVRTVNSLLGESDSPKDEGKGKNKKKSAKKPSKDIKYFIATPNRMEKILESTDVFFQGKDKLDIILDASYLDSKSNSLIAFENTVTLCKVLKTILDKKSSVKILLY